MTQSNCNELMTGGVKNDAITYCGHIVPQPTTDVNGKPLKHGRRLRLQAYEQARADVYAQRPPAPYNEAMNPFLGRQGELYQRFYQQTLHSWYYCEDLLDVLGGRPQAS